MIEKVTNKNFDEVLPLIKEYQEFYNVGNIDENKNRVYFQQFVKSNDDGVLYMLRVDNECVGFATVYKGFSSTRAESVAILNDLYVQPLFRGKGAGRELIEHVLVEVKAMGYGRLQWLTAEGNASAQKLYDGMGVNKSAWFFYAKET